jgi:hypothetical protein
MLLATCQPEYRVNPAILCFIYMGRNDLLSGRENNLRLCRFFVDATLCRAIEALLKLRIRILSND